MVEILVFLGAGAGAGVGEKNTGVGASQKRTGSATLGGGAAVQYKTIVQPGAVACRPPHTLPSLKK